VLAKSAKSTGYRVIAGPFADVSAAKAAVKRLKMDLDIDAAVIDPVRQISRSSRY
jgi:L,D-transpeptidase ErfK/SrfK